MKLSQCKFGLSGAGLGGIALLLAVFTFWAGPFSPQPTLESTVAEKAAAIKNATLDALLGKEVQPTYVEKKWDIDKYISVTIPVIAVFAILLAVISFIVREPLRISASAAALGASAIAFQFIAMYAMALLVVLLICAVLAGLSPG